MAQFNLGLLHETGRGVAEDLAQAAAWYERAALQGVTQAQFNLALLHQTGRGVEKDGTQALYWLEVAARHGAGAEQEQAVDAAARLAEILLAEDVDEARTRAAEFAPRPEGASVSGSGDHPDPLREPGRGAATPPRGPWLRPGAAGRRSRRADAQRRAPLSRRPGPHLARGREPVPASAGPRARALAGNRLLGPRRTKPHRDRGGSPERGRRRAAPRRPRCRRCGSRPGSGCPSRSPPVWRRSSVSRRRPAPHA